MERSSVQQADDEILRRVMGIGEIPSFVPPTTHTLHGLNAKKSLPFKSINIAHCCFH